MVDPLRAEVWHRLLRYEKKEDIDRLLTTQLVQRLARCNKRVNKEKQEEGG